MTCQQQLSVRSSAGVLEAPSGYALRCLQDIKAKRTVYLLQNRTFLFATNNTLAAYRQLRAEMSVSQIMVAGDSAGGGLTMACLQSLRNTSEPLPGCAALLSPNVDLSDSGAYGGADNPVSHNNYAGNYPRNHPGISPVFGEMQDLPPILVQFASDEAFADEATRLIEKLRAADVDVDCQTFDEAFHVFQMFTGLPEALAAIDRIAEYFRHRTMEQI